MFSNPIIRREVRAALRTRKAVLMQVLLLLVGALLIWRNWPAGGMAELGGQQARRILSVLALGEMAIVALFAPAFTAAALTGEREKNTLESLFVTALRPREIAWGKMVGSLWFLVLMVIGSLPAMAAPLMLGGVSWQMVLEVVGVLLLTTVYLGSIGLLVSSLMHRSYRAIIVTYAVLLVVCLGFALPAWPMSHSLMRGGGQTQQIAMHLLASMSPMEAMLSLVLDSSPYAVGSGLLPPLWVTFIPMSLLVMGISALACLIRLSRPMAPPRPREKLKVVERGKITARTFWFVVDPNKRKSMIRSWQNPVLMKEFRTRPMLQTQWLLRAVGLCLIGSVVLMILVAVAVRTMMDEDLSLIPPLTTAVAALMVVVVMLAGPAITGGAICSDRETGLWELIRSTRLSSWQIVVGKFFASVIPLLLLVAIPGLAVLMYLQLFSGADVPGTEPQRLAAVASSLGGVLAVAGMTVLMVATAGTFFSSVFSRTSTATAATYALMIVLGLGSLLVLLDREGFSERLVRQMFVLNPVAAAMDAGGSMSMRKYALVGENLRILAALTAGMLAVTIARVVQLRRPD